MQYLVTIHRPNDYDPSGEDEAMARDISALNAEMVAAGIRVFVGGLQSPTTARSLRLQPDGTVRTTDGVYLQAGEHVGGLWVLDINDADEALAWGLIDRIVPPEGLMDSAMALAADALPADQGHVAGLVRMTRGENA